MKTSRKLLSLIIASMCGTSSSALVAQEIPQASPIASSGRIGDLGDDTLGDGAFGGDNLGGDNLGDEVSSDPRRGSIRSDDSEESHSQPEGKPVSFRSPAFAIPGSAEGNAVATSCSDPCGSSCSSSGLSTKLGCRGWIETESLLWWGKGLGNSPLILGGTAPDSGSPRFPLIGGQDNPLGTDMLLGMRVTAGKWLDCDQNYGFMGRVFGIVSEGSSETYTNNGNYTGVAYFDTILGPATYNVNNTPLGNIGANTGTITVDNDLDLISAEATLRTRLLGENNGRMDLLTGYTFLRLDTAYQLTTQYTDGITNPILNGTVFTTQDTFGTKNIFHGGHLGLLSEVSAGRFSFNLLGKVALGNMQQTTSTAGSYSEVPPAGPSFSENRGIFAQNGNIGTISRNRFSFLPEVGGKMKYRLGRGQFGVGYTLLVLPSVAIAPDQIDQNIDFLNIGGVMTAPSSRFTTDTYFLHGIDLGYTLQF